MNLRYLLYLFLATSLFFLVFTFSFKTVNAQNVETQAQKEARLKLELIQVEKEQAETEKILESTKNQSASLERDILILNTKIKAAQLNIKAKNLQIESLSKDINKKQEKIIDLEGHIAKGKDALTQIMRKTNEVDDINFAEYILSSKNVSEMFIDFDNFDSIQSSLKTVFEKIRSDKSQTETEKTNLGIRKDQEMDARAVIEYEKTYQRELALKKSKAAEIRAALFELAGGSQAIPFEQALKYANEASRATGIRPAFLLSILTQESALG